MSDDKTPMTAMQAVQSVAASSAASPASPDLHAASASASMTETPAAESATDPAVHPTTEAPGPLPYDRHKAILDGAYKERDQFKTDFETYKQQHGWAEQVNRQQLDAITHWYTQAHQNPVEFALKLVDELSADSTHAPQLRSHAARLLRAARAQQADPAPAEIEPDIPVLDPNGNVVNQAYSATAMKEIVKREIAAALGKEVAPLREDLDRRTAKEAADAKAHEKTQYVDRQTQRIKTQIEQLPNAKAHWDAILVKANELAKADPDLSAGEAMRDAYYRVVLPKLDGATKAAVVDTYREKAAAKTESASSAATTPLQRPTNVRSLSKTIETLHGQLAR